MSLGIGRRQWTLLRDRVEAMPTFVPRRRQMHNDASINSPLEVYCILKKKMVAFFRPGQRFIKTLQANDLNVMKINWAV